MNLVNKKIMLSTVFTALLSVSTSAAVNVYTIDKTHSTVEFSVKHMALSTTRGFFSDYDGNIVWDDNGKNSSIDGSVQINSINTREVKRDDHLKSSDFFDAEHFPEMTLKSKSIKKSGSHYVMTADLTIRGVTKTIKVPLEVSGPVKDPWGKMRAHFGTSFKINRQDYSISFSKLMDNGGLLVGNDVTITLDIEGVQK